MERYGSIMEHCVTLWERYGSSAKRYRDVSHQPISVDCELEIGTPRMGIGSFGWLPRGYDAKGSVSHGC